MSIYFVPLLPACTDVEVTCDERTGSWLGGSKDCIDGHMDPLPLLDASETHDYIVLPITDTQ